MAPGEISFTSDPQLGKAVITANSWDEMCDRAAEYFSMRKPTVMGSSSTYAQTMYNLFTNTEFRAGKIASNETFEKLDIPEHPARGILNVLQDQVAPIMVKGYRPGEGIDADRYPTARVCTAVEELHTALAQESPRATSYSAFARGETSYDDYVTNLRKQLDSQGGGWVTVAPRDTAQQGNDSESAAVTSISRRNAEIWAERAGCVGYEIGGAQYQAGLIRGWDPATILKLGLPYNMPAHSLQRSQYANGLAELPTEIRQPLFDATAEVVGMHYRPGGLGKELVPWQPYNFHAVNYVNESTGYSPQDQTTAELLKAKCVPMPNWVFSPKFPLEALEKWTNRQIDIFASQGITLHQIRIKNPGQGKDWTSDAIWTHVKTMASVFKARGMLPPIVYIHNHDFNGLGGHVAAELFRKAQAEGFSTLVVDGGYRKNGTHNDNTVMTSALALASEQQEALVEYNYNQQAIEEVLCRFDSRTSQMTPWDSDWAGGTEGSDIRIAKEFGLDVRRINDAKEVANEVFPLERAVTPFSEYKLRLGIALMIESGIEPKTPEAVRSWVNKGGKLKVGGDVLVGLMRWETLVPKTPEVDKLLENMADELQAALAQQTMLIGLEDLPANFTAAQKHTALGYQQKGLDFVTLQAKGMDLSPLLLAPHVAHARPRALAVGTRFDVLPDPTNLSKRSQVEFLGFGTAPNKDILLNYLHEGQLVQVSMTDPNAVAGTAVASGPRKADPGNRLELGTVVPGELLSYSIEVGDTLKAGAPFCVLESMKMEMKISVPDELDGLVVKALPCKGRTKEKQGDILAPGDMLLEMKEA
jgi:biotin carboxyl carrier protein